MFEVRDFSKGCAITGSTINTSIMPIRGVLEWVEVQYDELPTAVQKEYTAPQ